MRRHSYQKTAREIGSNFELPFRSLLNALARCHHEDSTRRILLSSGRDSLYWILKSLNIKPNDIALLPSYLCVEVLKPFQDLEVPVKFYSIDHSMHVDMDDLTSKLTSDVKILLFINYWGFPLHLPSSHLKNIPLNTIVVEDNTHSILSSCIQEKISSQIRFASYRKMLPVIDGAEVTWDQELDAHLIPSQLNPSMLHHMSIWIRIIASVLKSAWLRSPKLYPKTTFRGLFYLSEHLTSRYQKPVGMSHISKRIYKSLNVSEIISARRDNFETLLRELNGVDKVRPLYNHLPSNVCPMGFPILVEARDCLIQHLIRKRIYTPVHWSIPPEISKQNFRESWEISDSILTLPIDHRYSYHDMFRMASEIKKFFKDG